MLEVRDLEHGYGRRNVLSVDTFTIPTGTVTAVVGPNGSGKSTLLRVLAFLETPRAGILQLDGAPIRTPAERRRARRRVTLVEQTPYLFSGTVQENMTYALSLHGIRRTEGTGRARQALERVLASDLAQRRADQLSSGEAQRVAIARALALEPAVLLLDEPASAADRATSTRLYQVLDEERSRGAAVCFASHQVEDAYRWSDHLVALADGRTGLVTPENLFRTVLPDGAGSKTARVGPLDIRVVTDRVGPVTLAIPADEVLVSNAPLRSSARNEFSGRVVRISEHDRDRVTIIVDVGVDLAARITPSALKELDIQVGSTVVLAVKALAVRVF
jgi:tungstate transport system ATP-binding protein